MSRKTERKPAIYQVKVSLKRIAPPIWRRLQMPADTTLEELHDIVQAAMGWENAHQHLFIVNGEEYGVNNSDFGSTLRNEGEAVLGQIVKQGERLVYVYDFGDEWEHEILIEQVSSAEKDEGMPCCIGGERACPPEDCGGPPGYALLLEALANPDTPESADRLDWLDGKDFDPEAFDPAAVSRLLSQA